MSQTNNKKPQQPAPIKTTSPNPEAIPLVPPPPVQFVLNTKQGIEVCSADANDVQGKQQVTVKTDSQLQCDQSCESLVYSQDGKYFVCCYKKHVEVIDTETKICIRRIEGENVSKSHFSPQNTFLVTLGKYTPNDPKGGNLAVWRLFEDVQQAPSTTTSTEEFTEAEQVKITAAPKNREQSRRSEAVARFVHKPTTDEFWPIVQWNGNETTCCALPLQGKLLFHDGKTMAPSTDPKLNHKINVTHFNMSSRGTLALYCREEKKQSQVLVLRHPYQQSNKSNISFNKAEDVVMKWNRIGSALLVHTTTQSDSEYSSYYGENQLYFMRANGTFTCNVVLKKEGPILDVAWSPKGNEFIVVYGFTPAKATLFNESTQEIFDFGTGARNRVSWSPSGKLVCLCGFGGMQGDMEFWERDKKRKIGQANAKEASVHGWSPCGRFFMTATVTPTLRVSNKYQLWKYNGVLQQERQFDTLYQAVWRPSLIGANEEIIDPNNSVRIPSPRGLQEGKSLMSQKKETEVKKAYVPPHMRSAGGGSGGGFQALSDDNDRSIYKRGGEEAPSRPNQPKKTTTNFVGAQKLELQSQQHYVPGFHVPVGASSSNQQSSGDDAQKKKRKRKKKPTGAAVVGSQEIAE
ncbi:translation initiation factor 2A [Acrasis kona]|uniref:Eukaryotic translation initiation factor 2A n=1 Tax=Acrasis kona TaxID=1008807 RepID=A0AAW2YSW9_9EUKA